MLRRTTTLILLLLPTVATPYAAPAPRLKKFTSPDGKLTAVVIPVDKEKGFEENESRILNQDGKNKLLRAQDFSSDDGEHGYGVAEAKWTPDSQYLVCRLRSSGGHSPMYEAVMFWDRRKDRFYQLVDFTASQEFAVESPDKIRLSTWPGLNQPWSRSAI